jgi:hypothetical protein
MRSSSIVSAFTVLSTLSGTTLCATAITEDKIETWTLNSLNIEQDGHGPGPSNRTTGTLSIKLSKGDMPFSYCNSTWESYTSVNTVPLGWQKCTAENLWFRLVSRQEIFDFPPVEVDFLEQGVWEEWHDGTKGLVNYPKIMNKKFWLIRKFRWLNGTTIEALFSKKRMLHSILMAWTSSRLPKLLGWLAVLTTQAGLSRALR